MGGLLLDAKNRLVKDAALFRGTLTHAAVAPAPLFRQAILAGAAGVILYHNHPSGDPEPSPEDLATTKRFLAAGREIGIEVKDHVIVGRGRWVSFHERGLLR
jgi:DNA repair protein RadC